MSTEVDLIMVYHKSNARIFTSYLDASVEMPDHRLVFEKRLPMDDQCM